MNDPQLIRDDSPHRVEMSEHSKVAVSKTGDVGAPSVRKVLAVPDAVVEESSALQEHRVLVPQALAPDKAENVVLAPPPLLAATAQALDIPAASVAGGDLLEVPLGHTTSLLALEVPAGASGAVSALAIPAGESGSLAALAIPVDQAGALSALDIPPGEDPSRPTLDIPVGEQAPAPTLELTPGSQARARPDVATIKAMLSDLKAPEGVALQEQLGGPDPVWREMDYPARVVKLKIENDKVRVKLDALEDLERSAGAARNGD